MPRGLTPVGVRGELDVASSLGCDCVCRVAGFGWSRDGVARLRWPRGRLPASGLFRIRRVRDVSAGRSACSLLPGPARQNVPCVLRPTRTPPSSQERGHHLVRLLAARRTNNSRPWLGEGDSRGRFYAPITCAPSHIQVRLNAPPRLYRLSGPWSQVHGLSIILEHLGLSTSAAFVCAFNNSWSTTASP